MPDQTDKLLQQLQDLDNSTDLSVPLPGMAVIEDRTIKVTVQDLKAAIKKNPSHEVTTAYKKATRNLPPDNQVFVSRVDLQCLLENRKVDHYDIEEVRHGVKRRIKTKKVGQLLSPDKMKVAKSTEPKS